LKFIVFFAISSKAACLKQSMRLAPHKHLTNLVIVSKYIILSIYLPTHIAYPVNCYQILLLCILWCL